MKAFRKNALRAAIGLALSTGALGVTQAAPGLYLGVGVGASVSDLSNDAAASAIQSGLASGGDVAFDPPNGGVTASTDTTDFAWKVFLGYQFNDHFALEAAYVDLGSTSATFTGNVSSSSVFDGPEGISGMASRDITGVALWGVGILPLQHGFSFFGKVGAFRWHDDDHASATLEFGRDVSGTQHRTGTDIAIGAGAGYDIGNHIGVRLEWERYSIDSDNIDVFGGTASWKF